MKLTDLISRDNCALCGSDESIDFLDFPDIPIIQCSSCNFIYSSKIFSDEVLDSYYENNFGSKRHLEDQIVNAKNNIWVVLKYLNILQIKNILDVGTGYGFFLNEINKQDKVNTTGIELSQQEAEYAQNTLKLNVHNSSLNQSGLKKNYYDLVTSFEVIEHVRKPIDFINEMVQYVKVDGYLLIMTNNFESRLSKSLGAGNPNWIPHSHISHFSPITLKNAIETTKNLRIVKSMSYTPWEGLLRDIYYKLRGIKKTPYESFNLSSILENEMQSQYKLFQLRKLINKWWLQLTITEKMDGDLMYFLAKRIS